jgi:hypothetical protein
MMHAQRLGEAKRCHVFVYARLQWLHLISFSDFATTIKPRSSSCGMQLFSSDRARESSGIFLSLIFVLTCSEKPTYHGATEILQG